MKATNALYFNVNSSHCKSIASWRAEVDWELHRRRPYVVVDPIDQNGLLYLSEREYQAMVRTCLSTQDTLLVVLRPGDTLDKFQVVREGSNEPEVSQENQMDEESNSPFGSLSRKRKDRGGRVGHKSLLAKALLGGISLGIRKSVKDSMVRPTQGNLRLLFVQWGRQLVHWSGRTTRAHHTKVFSEMSLVLLRDLEKNGPNAVIQRLKISYRVVFKYLAGDTLTSTDDLGARIALANGLPKWLPLPLRAAIRARSTIWIRIVGSLLFSYKGLKGDYGNVDYSTILTPRFEGEEALREFKAFIPTFWNKIVKLTNKKGLMKPNLKPQSLHFSLSAGPNHSIAQLGAVLDLIAWYYHPSGNNYVLEWMELVEDKLGLYAWKAIDLVRSRTFQTNTDKLLDAVKVPQLGKLATKFEAAGKIRVFAILDYWTQHILKPVHKWLFNVLELLPTDATFDQQKGVDTLASENHKNYFCFDLKSATDMIPVQLYEILLEPVLGQKLTELWSKLLTDRDFRKPGKTEETIRYGRGQPMGAYSSWGSLALVHHAIVQMAYDNACIAIHGRPNQDWFLNYRVLGDDIVIADKAVADSYLSLLRSFDVKVSLAKGVISDQGLLDFASQFVQDGLNLSPSSLKEELAIQTYSRRSEMAARLVKRGWALRKFTAVFRLLLSPNAWDRSMANLAKGRFTQELDMILRSALSLQGPLLRLFGDSTLLFRACLHGRNRTAGLLGDLGRIMSDESGEFSSQPLTRAELYIVKELAKEAHAAVHTAQQKAIDSEVGFREIRDKLYILYGELYEVLLITPFEGPTVGTRDFTKPFVIHEKDDEGVIHTFEDWDGGFHLTPFEYPGRFERAGILGSDLTREADFLLKKIEDATEETSPKEAFDLLARLNDLEGEFPLLPSFLSGKKFYEKFLRHRAKAKRKTPLSTAMKIAIERRGQYVDWIRDLKDKSVTEPFLLRHSHARRERF